MKITPDLDSAALWNLVPDALLAVEASGRIARANDAASEMFGAEPEELVGRPIEDLIDEADRAGHVGRRSRWTRTPRPRLMGSSRDLPALTLDGRKINVQVALNPIRIDGRQLTIAVIRDVTSDTQARREQAIARDEIVQRMFGLGMSLRSVIPAVEATETAGRIVAVVEGMSDIAESFDDGHGDGPRGPPAEER